MATYQIPQFLDSGDRIFGTLNTRQFAYALFGFLISFGLYSVINSSVPGLGFYALVPVSPIAAVSAYLALGRFNGRDAEIYVLKGIVFFSKPRQMVYSRMPDTSDLDQKLIALTPANIIKEWSDRLNNQSNQPQVVPFKMQDAKTKAQKIQEIGKLIDLTSANTAQTIAEKELILDNLTTHQKFITSLRANSMKNIDRPIRIPNSPNIEPVLPSTLETDEISNLFKAHSIGG